MLYYKIYRGSFGIINHRNMYINIMGTGVNIRMRNIAFIIVSSSSKYSPIPEHTPPTSELRFLNNLFIMNLFIFCKKSFI